MRSCPSDHSARVRLTPLTGRSHQLRVQQSLGHPILGDGFYATPIHFHCEADF